MVEWPPVCPKQQAWTPKAGSSVLSWLTPSLLQLAHKVKQSQRKIAAAEKIECTKGALNVYVPLVMVSILGRKRTLADKTVDQNGSIYTSLDPPLFSLDSTFKVLLVSSSR
jgi:hypothetical protein